MADGYGAGLFDPSGPKGFATAVEGISGALKGVTTAFDSFGSDASTSLTKISAAVDALLGKLSSATTALSSLNAGGGGGGGGPQSTANVPAPDQSGIRPGNQWAGAPAPPSSGTGAGDPLTGMPQSTAATGGPGWLSRNFGKMTQGTATQAGGGEATMGQRAVQSMVPAAIGAAGNYAGGLASAAVQGATIGQMYAPAFGVSSRSLYTIPTGTLATSPQDYAQSNLYAMQNLGMAPGTQNWSSIMGPNGGLNQLMTLFPGGLSRTQAAQTYGSMMQPQNLNMSLAFGFNFSPGGKMQTPQQQYEQVFNKFSQTVGGKPTGKQVEDWLRPGGPWSQNLAQEVGWQPGSTEYQGFVNYALTKVGVQNQGGQMPSNIGSQAGASKTPLGATPGYAQLQTQSARSQAESQAEPALAQAAKDLNNAATQLLRLVDPFASILGGGGPGGMMGSLAGTAMTGASLVVGGKVASTVGRKVLGSSMVQKVGGAALRKVVPKGGSGLLGKVGGLFGRGAAGAAEAGGEDVAATAGVEAAGLGLDATGIGLPAGLALGAAGLIAGPAIGSAVSHVGHFLGGLFGGGSPAGASTPQGGGNLAQNAMLQVLGNKPPTNSLLACLTQPLKKDDKTLAAALVYDQGGGVTTGQGGGSSGGGGGGSGGGGGGTVGGWNDRGGGTSGPVDLAGVFKKSSSSTSSSGGSASGTPSSFSGNIPAGGNYDVNSWAAALLTAIGAPTNAANTTSIVNWENKEGGNWHNTAKYNPLNTTLKMPGSSGMAGGNSAGVQAYTSWQQGLEATVDTLKSSAYNDIVSALQAGKGLSGGSYKGLSTWSGGGYSSLARGTQLVARTQLALLHRGEAVVPAADNYSAGSYNMKGSGSSAGGVYLNFTAGSVVLQVPAGSSQQDMETLANQFVSAIAKPSIIAGVRSQ